jgi:hypothetical protein
MAVCNSDTVLSQACDSGFKQLAESSPALAHAVLNRILCDLVIGPPGSNFRITDDGGFRLTSDGGSRIISI